ncbi:hypothetical protein [Chryseolinea lacunae]|uniref:Uncharacterized protein n=1 Tax=Chryseolinea lacunae TaxID=2801331 RepID=A0ABS1KXZ8_9BACT|nr:hypothetical protein [Chryseolinea lacunae]MBL0744325.1 hypothetical protein [Chryseolinea lacunae]
MLKAPLLVCILIAGADGDIDRKEIKEAINVAQSKSKGKTALTGYFREVSQDFEDKLKILVQSYPYESTQRTPLLTQELGQINAVWKKIDQAFAIQLYQMMKELAAKVASSSGGLWGMKSVNTEEARLIQLTMISDPAQN